jgi:hypothetical protein
MADIRDTWMSPADAFPLLRAHFYSLKTFKYHLGRRELNGLQACDAVRLTPFRKLIVNPDRIRAWAMAETSSQAAA